MNINNFLLASWLPWNFHRSSTCCCRWGEKQLWNGLKKHCHCYKASRKQLKIARKNKDLGRKLFWHKFSLESRSQATIFLQRIWYRDIVLKIIFLTKRKAINFLNFNYFLFSNFQNISRDFKAAHWSDFFCLKKFSSSPRLLFGPKILFSTCFELSDKL